MEENDIDGPPADESESGASAASPEDAEPVPAGVSENADWHVLLQRIEKVGQHQEHLLKIFREKVRYDSGRDQIIDRLHQDLQDHRNDLLGKTVLPVLRDLVRLRDQLLKFVAARREYPTGKRDWDNLLDNVTSFGEDIIEILERYGLVVFSEEGVEFNPRTQQPVGTVPTEDAALHRTVAERIGPGFRWEDQIIQHEKVAVFRAEVAPAEAEPADDQEA